jgi:molybdenum cofactor cytidylyltransferase
LKFGRMAVAASEGAILAHSVKAPGVSLKKGDVLGAAQIAALEEAGIMAIVAARLEPGDVEENAAAARLARHIAGAHVRLEAPFTGRCNLMAEVAGLVRVEAATIDRVNAVDESITVATLEPMRPVVAGEMIATIKIIPFAVPGGQLGRGIAAAAAPSVSIAPFRPQRIGVVSTMLPGLKPATVTKTLRLLEARLAPAGATILRETRVAHEVHALAAAITAMAAVDIIVVFGASAITDRRDVVPVAIELAGGVVHHLGMPVDPGNLLLLGEIAFAPERRVAVIGAPGCARSPKENGFDFVLRRLLADVPVTGADLRAMGVGGLLSEIVSRPQPRQPPEDRDGTASIDAVSREDGRREDGRRA